MAKKAKLNKADEPTKEIEKPVVEKKEAVVDNAPALPLSLEGVRMVSMVVSGGTVTVVSVAGDGSKTEVVLPVKGDSVNVKVS